MKEPQFSPRPWRVPPNSTIHMDVSPEAERYSTTMKAAGGAVVLGRDPAHEPANHAQLERATELAEESINSAHPPAPSLRGTARRGIFLQKCFKL